MMVKQTISAFLGILIASFVSDAGISQAQISQFSDLEYPYEVQYQELDNGQQVAYIDEGEGPAVILIHGLGSYIPAWKQNITALNKINRVVALDLPGYGKSSKEVREYSIPFFADVVVRLQDSLGIEKAVWAGHSMGGQIALRGALSNPDKISKLVLLAPAGFEQFSDQEGMMMKSAVTPESIAATPDSLIRQTLKTTFYDFPDEAQFMVEDRVAIRSAENFDGYARAYAGSVEAMLDDFIFNDLSEIEQPILIVYGIQDKLIPNRQFHPDLTTQKVADQGHKKLANSTLNMVDEAGHFVHFEQAEIVNKMILNFLKDN